MCYISSVYVFIIFSTLFFFSLQSRVFVGLCFCCYRSSLFDSKSQVFVKRLNLLLL